jgi:HlyD family secretion protein
LRRFLPLTLVGLLLAGSAVGYARWQAQVPDDLDIQTAALARGDVRRVVATSGTVRPLTTVEVGSQLSGQIREIYADHSTAVRQGQEIARIDPRTFASKVREAEAAVKVAEAGTELQRAAITRAEANRRKAERDHRRAESLQARGTASQATLDTAVAAFEAAEAELAIAKAEAANAEATLAQRQAGLESARIELDRTYIRAPIDGVVIERSVEVGQTVAASLSAPKLFTIAQDLTRIEIDAQVDEADMGQVKVGNPVTFGVDAFPEESFRGSVAQLRLAPVNLQNVVTYTVVIAARNDDGRLLPGMTANVEILTGERRDVRVVPNEALRFRPRGAAERLVREQPAAVPGRRAPGAGTVWTLEPDGTLTPHEVRLGLSDRAVTELTGTAPEEGAAVVLRVRERGS